MTNVRLHKWIGFPAKNTIEKKMLSSDSYLRTRRHGRRKIKQEDRAVRATRVCFFKSLGIAYKCPIVKSNQHDGPNEFGLLKDERSFFFGHSACSFRVVSFSLVGQKNIVSRNFNVSPFRGTVQDTAPLPWTSFTVCPNLPNKISNLQLTKIKSTSFKSVQIFRNKRKTKEIKTEVLKFV